MVPKGETNHCAPGRYGRPGVVRPNGRGCDRCRRTLEENLVEREADAGGGSAPSPARPGPLLARRDRRQIWREREEGPARLRESAQLPSSDVPTEDVWSALRTDDRRVTTNYLIAEQDVAGPFLSKLPSKMEEMKDLPKLGFTSPREELAEKFYMSEQLLAALNRGQRFDRAGDSIIVLDTGTAENGAPSRADRVEVDKSRQTVKLFDKSNALIGFYPATVGSEEKPSPSGTLKVTEVDRNPTYRYNPEYRFKGIRSRKPFTIKPGPNNPVGTVWINLTAEGYGIHGTPLPGKISKAESHGCVRLTNWDAERVAASVAKGTLVAFVDGSR